MYNINLKINDLVGLGISIDAYSNFNIDYIKDIVENKYNIDRNTYNLHDYIGIVTDKNINSRVYNNNLNLSIVPKVRGGKGNALKYALGGTAALGGFSLLQGDQQRRGQAMQSDAQLQQQQMKLQNDQYTAQLAFQEKQLKQSGEFSKEKLAADKAIRMKELSTKAIRMKESSTSMFGESGPGEDVKLYIGICCCCICILFTILIIKKFN